MTAVPRYPRHGTGTPTIARFAVVLAMATACTQGRGPTSDGDSNGAPGWTGIRVSGTQFVDGDGVEFVPRGIGIGEWHNLESYMIQVDSPDVGGLGQQKLTDGLVAALGQSGADRFFAAWDANVITESDIALWESWGVNSIRLPMNYHALSSAPGVYTESGFSAMDDFIALCRAHHIYVILDLHAAPGSQNCEQMSDSPDGVARLWSEPDTYSPWAIDLWQTVAARYANEPAVAGYDILDEPYDTEASGDFAAGPTVLRDFYVDVTAAIRSVDPNHVLFFEGTNWSSSDGTTDGFAALEPAWDPQMAWSFHKYWDANTTRAIQPYLDLRARTIRPVWNGETGEDDADGWSGDMVTLLGANDIGWNEWTYKKVDNTANFYSIARPDGWDAMATYLATYADTGVGTPPADAQTVMMTLAANAATSQCSLNAPWLSETFGM